MAGQQVSGRGISRRAVFLRLGLISGAVLGGGELAVYLIEQAVKNPVQAYSFSDFALSSSWSPDGKRVATVGWDEYATPWGVAALQIWDAATGEFLKSGATDITVGPGGVPVDVVWSSDGKQVIAFVGYMGVSPLVREKRVAETIQVWDVRRTQLVKNILVTDHVLPLGPGKDAYSSLVQAEALCESYFAAIKNPARQLNGQTQYATILEIWDIEKGSLSFTQTLRDPGQGRLGDVFSIKWAPDRRRLAILINDLAKSWHCEIWDIPARKRVQTFSVALAFPQKINWSPDGRQVAIGQVCYDASTGRELQMYQLKKGQLNQEFLGWLPDGKHVLMRANYVKNEVLAAYTSPLTILDASQDREIHVYVNVRGEIRPSPRGDYFLATSPRASTVDVYRTILD